MSQTKAPSMVDAKKEENKDITPKYTEAEKHYIKQCQTTLSQMVTERSQKRPQFNDMTWDQWDDIMIKADISYIPPAKNKGDTRIVTGMTRQKDSTLLSTALSYDFEPSCVAYNEKDLIINQIGEEAEDMVRKSRQMEEYDSKRPLAYRGIISRGTYYAMEMYIEKYGYEKKLPKNYRIGTVKNVNWTEKLIKSYEGCEIHLLDPKKVYLSSLSEFFIQNQEAVAIVDRLSYSAAAEMYVDWERWANVSKTFASLGGGMSEPQSKWSPYWSMSEVKSGEVERVLIMRKGTNELQLFLSGIMMLPVTLLGFDSKQQPIVSGFPLTAISPSGMYPIIKGDFEPVEGFGISKGQPANMYVDQQVQDEFLKLMIEKTKQSFDPARANNSGRVLTRQNFRPSTITDDLDAKKIIPLVDTQGVTPGEFSFFQLIKNQMEEKSVNQQYEGGDTSNMTATQVIENKKQSLLKLGLTLDAPVRWERDFATLRWFNILAHWTNEQDKGINKMKDNIKANYKTMTVEKTVKGAKVRKIIRFTDQVQAQQEEDPNGFKLQQEEEQYKKETGVDIRISLINPKKLNNLKATWHWTVTPNDKKDDTLSRLIFTQNIQDAINFFGPDSLKVDNLKQRFAIVIGEDYQTWFRTEQEVASAMLEQSDMNNPQQQKITSPIQKPNMKQALGRGV